MTDQNDIRLFRISSTGECSELDTPDYFSDMDADAQIMVVPTQATWKRAMKLPNPDKLPRSFFVGKDFFSADTLPLATYQHEKGNPGMAVMAQWETAYTRQARGWRKRVSPVAQVEDFCADKLGRDCVIESVAGAHLVMYFGHGHYFGLNGYHGITARHFQPDKPIGLFWSWSCNTLFGRNSFALRMLQAGLVKAYIGTSDPKARSCDNLRLAELSAEVLLQERPITLMGWLDKLTLAVQAVGDAQLCSAWSNYHVLGDLTLTLPKFNRGHQ